MGLAKWTGCATSGALAVLFLHGAALAQSAPTCSFDAAGAAVTVAVNGQTANISRTSAGVIRLNGVACSGATTANTDRIDIRGGALKDVVYLLGEFAPGRTAESDGKSEIEISLTEIQNLTVMLGAGDDVFVYTGTGVDLGGDGDDDLVGRIPGIVQGGAGNDTIDFSLTTASAGGITLSGGAGDDDLIGGASANVLEGGAGDDMLEGNGGNDRLDGGAGDDVELGGAGIDTFTTGAAPDGADFIDGGDKSDQIDFHLRTGGVTLTVSAGGADDGEAGEGDEVVSVQNAIGGAGDDFMVGDSAVNTFEGRGGNDQLFGAENHDQLLGGDGDDYLQGDVGRNTLRGGPGNDTLVGHPSSDDRFFGEDGDDEIVGNSDGHLENVDCGPGNDTAEGNDEDNFIACEVL